MKDGGPAFPRIGVLGPDEDRPNQTVWWDEGDSGMSLRDYFAAKALPWISQFNSVDGEAVTFEAIAKHSYEMADAMLKARES